MIKLSSGLKEKLLEVGLPGLSNDWAVDMCEGEKVLVTFPCNTASFNFEVYNGGMSMCITKAMESVVQVSGNIDRFVLRNVVDTDVYLSGKCGTEDDSEMTLDKTNATKGKKIWIDTFKVWI